MAGWAKFGRLSRRREKAEVVCLAADGPSERLKELARLPVTAGTARPLRVFADAGFLLTAGLAAAQTPPTTPTPATKPAAKPAPATLLGTASPCGGNVPGRILAMAGDGQSAAFHITPTIRKEDGKPATTLDQRRVHFGLALGGTVAGDFQYETTLDFRPLPDKVKDGRACASAWG